MSNQAPEIFVMDKGPIQPFRAIPEGSKFFDHIGNLCIKVSELNGVNSVTVHPVSKEMPQACWLTELAPVRPTRFS